VRAKSQEKDSSDDYDYHLLKNLLIVMKNLYSYYQRSIRNETCMDTTRRKDCQKGRDAATKTKTKQQVDNFPNNT